MASRTSLAKRGLVGAVRLVAVGLHDWMRSKLGLEPAYIKIVGREGSLSFMQLTAEEEVAYYSKHPKVYQVSALHVWCVPLVFFIKNIFDLLPTKVGF